MAITKVKFLEPFIFNGTVGGTLYSVEVTTVPSSNAGVLFGYLDDALAEELETLGLVQEF